MYPLVSSPWPAVAALGILAATFIVARTLQGSKPSERPEIIRALATLACAILSPWKRASKKDTDDTA
jgi:hypothetical protein